MGDLKARILGGVRWGLSIAVIVGAIGVASALGSGSEFEARYHMGVPELAALYLFCGAIGGATFGALRPLASSLIGSGLLGLLVAVSVYLPVAHAIYPRIALTSGEFLVSWLGPAMVLGPVVGVAFWIRFGRRN